MIKGDIGDWVFGLGMSEHSNLIASSSFNNGHDAHTAAGMEVEEVKEFKPIPGSRRSRHSFKRPSIGNCEYCTCNNDFGLFLDV